LASLRNGGNNLRKGYTIGKALCYNYTLFRQFFSRATCAFASLIVCSLSWTIKKL